MTRARARGRDRSHKKIWDLLRETEQILKEKTEISKETDRILKETECILKENAEGAKETDRQLREVKEQFKDLEKRFNDTDRFLKKMSRDMGGLHRSLGELVEVLIAGRLWEKFAGYPYNLKQAYSRIPVYDGNGSPRTEIDILLADTEWVMAVEVKRRLAKEDVDYHLKRMALIRKYPPLGTGDKRLLGAVAGGVVDPDAAAYALEAGFFVLELSGKAVNLLPPPPGFQPREW
jgi:ElaB/YqjD/DUF883 family membrane-anchored ribosome-binding protein